MSDRPNPGPIEYWNRAAQRREIEQVYGDAFVRLLYVWGVGVWLTRHFLARPWLSKLMGLFKSSWLSRGGIPSFVRKFQIPMQEYETASYRSFNEFFIRKFKHGRREFVSNPNFLAAPCEGRYLAFESIRFDQTFPVKGSELRADALLGDPTKALPFKDGPLVICRLCPVDYHRFHFPDSGEFVENWRIPGFLHSVNPLALQVKSDIFISNERHVTIMKTDHFGLLAYIEVGALCVGKIVQTHPLQGKFERGKEKGYFLFGGSTVILLGQKERWLPDADLLEKTQFKIETLVKLGNSIGRART